MGGMLLQHLGRHGLAVEPLLQVVERRHGLLAAHQKLAVEHAVEVDGLDDVGKGAGDVLAGAAIEPLHAIRGGDLHADAVPFPFGAEMGGVERVELGAVDGIGQHRRQEGAAGIAAGPGRARQQPVEQRPVGGGEAVPDLLHLIDRLAADIGDGLLGEPRRDADAQRAGQELQERPASRRIEGVQPALQDGRRLGLRGALQGFDHLAERGRRSGGRIGLPDQRQGLGEVADIVVGEVEQLRPDLVLAEAAQQRGLGGGEVEPAGQGGQRPAAVGIGRLAQIGLDQPELGVAGRLVGEGVEKGGKGLH